MIGNIPFYIWIMIGLVIGFGLMLFIYSFKQDGVIHIFQEEDTDKYLFEFRVPPEEIPTMSHVIFTVKIAPKDADSQNLQSS